VEPNDVALSTERPKPLTQHRLKSLRRDAEAHHAIVWQPSSNAMKTDYIGHDRVYKRLKAKGAFGWTSEADQI
jgi:hypothetical protein